MGGEEMKGGERGIGVGIRTERSAPTASAKST